jgi:hypothetical protein
MKTSVKSVYHPGSKIRISAKLITYLMRGRSPLFSRVGFGAVFVLAIAAAFYTSSSVSAALNSSRNSVQPNGTSSSGGNIAGASITQQQNAPFLSSNSSLLSPLMFLPQPPQGPGDEAIATFAVVNDLCTNTPQTNFVLGDKVCAKAANAPADPPAVYRRINWADTKGFVQQSVDVATSTQADIYQLPPDNTSNIGGQTVDNRGTWTVSSNSTGDNTTRAIAYFNVSDPLNKAADLVVYNFSTTGDPIEPGTNTGFFLWLSNVGPDPAVNVHLTMAVPPNMAFAPPASTSSAFTCAENAGVIDCSLPGTNPSWASGSVATITLNFLVSGGASNGVISPTANISSDTFDPRLDSNSSNAEVEVRAAGAAPATCSLGCPGDITVTASSAGGSAVVNFAGSVEVSGDCGTISYSPASGSTFSVGTHPVTVTSGGGSGGSCSFTVTVVDPAVSPAPTITCPADTGAQAAAGNTSAVVNPGAATATGTGVSVSGKRSDNDCIPQPGDTCGELSDPYPVGMTIITWTATDSDGRSASCQQRITVTSADAFTVSCPPARSFNANDCAGYTATAGDIGTPTTSGGQAPVVIVGRRSDNLDLHNDAYPVGQTNITWTATDNLGRVASCTQAINVATGAGGDSTPPTLVVPPNVTATTSSCNSTLDDELGTASADDNCSAVTITRSGVPTFACPTPSDPNRRCESFVFPTGTTVVTYTARDASGNTTIGTQNVTVTESPAIPPTIVAPADSSAYADENCQAPVPNYTAGSTASDNCGSVTLSQSPAAGTSVGYGPHTVTVTATDPSGNTATDQVVFTVNDNTPPTVTAPADSSANANASCQAAVPNYTTGSTAADNCGTATLSQSPAAGTLVGYGPHTVTVTANDGHGNTNSDDVVFTVNDVTAPTITAPADSAAFANANCQAAVPDYRPGTVAADNCGNVTLSQSPAPGTLVGYGPHTVTVTANDGHGNTTSDDVVFTVNDNTPPVISCPANITVYLPLNTTATSMAVSYPAATATDNCGQPINLGYSKASGSVFNMGPTPVTATATDSHGNTASCTFTVTVLYDFTGFFQPVDNLPTVNQMKAGQAVPTKFSLSGNKGLNIFAAGSPNSIQVTCDTGAPLSDVEETVTAGNSSLSYDGSADRYNYVWKTESSWKNTCRQLNVVLNDGSVHIAIFKFK